MSHTHSANQGEAPDPRAGVATYFFSASAEGSSILFPKANEERLPWMSPDTAVLAASGSSRPGVEAETLQGRLGGEGVLSGGPELGGLGKPPSLGSVLSTLQFREERAQMPLLPRRVKGGPPGTRRLTEFSFPGFCLRLDLP